MKKTFALITLLCLLQIACAPISNELRDAIAFGDIIEVNQYSNSINKPLRLRLFRSPVAHHGCPEQNSVCGFHYFLSVSTMGDNPKTSIFPLKVTDEITDIHWLDSPAANTVRLELTLGNSAAAIDHHPAINQPLDVVQITVSTEALNESLIQRTPANANTTGGASVAF